MSTRRKLILGAISASLSAVSIKSKFFPAQVFRPAKADAELGFDIRELNDADADLGFRPDFFVATPEVRAAFVEWEDLKPEVRTPVSWASDEESIDYRHVGVSTSKEEFDLTHSVLESLCMVNRFDVGDHQRVLFGLRGCALASGDQSSTGSSINLVEDQPDHLLQRCVMGVWNRGEKTISAFKASTVPNANHMYRYYNGISGANLLPTGLHSYDVGTHRPQSRFPQRGAFRQRRAIVVLRTEDELKYTTKDHWDEGSGSPPFDNIHAASIDSREKVPRFSSAGCQTLPGSYVDPERQITTGLWSEFRKSVGLVDPPADEDYGKTFKYVLLTGREARIAASALAVGQTRAILSLRRLRFGSSGPEVAALQRSLKVEAVDGDFGRDTMWRFIKWQQQKNPNSADAIVAPDLAEALGFSISLA